MKFTLATALGLTFGLISLAGAAGYSSLEERMSQKDMHATGLDKLSPTELKSLNDWLQLHTVGTLSKAHSAETSEEKFYPEPEDKVEVDDQIDGKFTGWRGKTVLTLKNGQEWQQVESGVRCIDYKVVDPKVTIKPMMMGSWLLTVVNTECNMQVRRIK